MNWVDYLVPFGTAGGGAASVYGLVVRPRQKEHERHEKERAEQRRQSDGFMYGVKPIEGVTSGALSAPVRLHAVEQSMEKVVGSVDKLTIRMDEANGTARATKKDVADIKVMVADIAGKPPASVAEVKEAVSHESQAMEARQAELLGAIKQDSTRLVHDMLPNDGTSSRDVLDSVVSEQDRVKKELSEKDDKE